MKMKKQPKTMTIQVRLTLTNAEWLKVSDLSHAGRCTFPAQLSLLVSRALKEAP